ncbi:MAG: LEA type 2 family protein [candidate division WOR-3 bacterium]
MRKLLLFLISFLSCTWIAQRKALANCDFSLHGAKLVNADFSGFELELKLNAKNPNDVDAVLDRLDYTLFMEDVEVAQGVVSEKQTIPKRGEGIITTRLKIKYSTIPKMVDVVMAAVSKKKSKIRMAGTVHFDTPIGTISQDIEVERTVNLD